MDFQLYQKILNDSSQQVMNVMLQSATYIQLLLVLLVLVFLSYRKYDS